MRSSHTKGGPSPPRLERALHLALGIALRDVAALVVRFLAAGERELDLRAAVLPVQARGDERVPALAHLARERVDLPPLEQEPAVAVGVVVRDVAVAVLGDVGADEPDLVAAHLAEGPLEVRLSVAEGLHLRADELEPRLYPLDEVVVVPGAAVVDDELLCHRGIVPTSQERSSTR